MPDSNLLLPDGLTRDELAGKLENIMSSARVLNLAIAGLSTDSSVDTDSTEVLRHLACDHIIHPLFDLVIQLRGDAEVSNG